MALIKFVILFTIVGCVATFRHGAPKSACNSLTPKHGHHRSQDRPAPFTLTAALDFSQPGKTFKVTLKGARATDYFQGFLVQARDENATPIGQFSVVDEFSDISQLLTCKHSGVS